MRARFIVLVFAACAGREPRIDSPGRDLSSLPAPHRQPLAITPLRAPLDLKARVGGRDKRDPIAVALAWAGELGTPVDAASVDELLAWAERSHRLRAADDTPRPGDLLVFDHVVAIAIARDARGITEFVYLARGVVRRGFVDVRRPKRKRDDGGAVINTNLGHGKRGRGTRYLAGQLLSNVVRMSRE